jgi:hypothetical protein
MKRDEIQHLLGGYAAGTLTPEEETILFAAAIEDQELFNALADEEALRELLADPESRGYLRAALAEAAESAPVATRSRRWWPVAAGISAIAAGLAIFTVIGIQRSEKSPEASVAVAPQQQTQPTEMAKNIPASPAAQPAKHADAVDDGGAAAKDTVKSRARTFEPPSPAAPAAGVKMKPADAPPTLGAASRAKEENKLAEKELEKAVAPPPPPPPPAPVTVAAEASSGGVMQSSAPQTTASQLFLAQYRQNARGGGATAPGRAATRALGSGAVERSRAEAPAQRRQEADRRAAPPAADTQQAPAAEPQSPPANRGIRYQILRKNSQGQFVQTRLDTRFEAGDEIILQVDKNAPDAVTIVSGADGAVNIPVVSQTSVQAQSAPIRLSTGAMDLSIILAPPALRDALGRASGPAQGQLVEQSGNLMYVVLPGPNASPVVARLRLTVH